MIPKNVSSKYILSRVLSNLNLQDESFRVSDAIEFIGEAVNKIGGFPIYNIKVTGKEDEPVLVVSNYQVRLPDDVYRVLGVAYSTSETGPFIALRYGTGTFDYRQPSNSETTTVTPIAPDNAVISLAMTLYNLTYENAVTYINSNPGIKQELIGLLNVQSESSTINSTSSYSVDRTYVINNSYIKLNVATGYLMVAYQAIPTDLEGYPLVPDDEGFIEAVYWYIQMKLLYPEWAAGRITDRVYYHAESKWRFYAKQAYANAIMPNVDMLESIKNTWLKLVPEIDDFSTFFSATGEQQTIYNANKNTTLSNIYSYR